MFVRGLESCVLRQHPALTHYLEKLGDTDLLKLPCDSSDCWIYAKAEWTNPKGKRRGIPDFREQFAYLAGQLDQLGLASLHVGDGRAFGFQPAG